MNGPLPRLRKILEYHERLGSRLAFPGDWGERSFRGWLLIDLLHSELGWPSEHLLLGEVFDILTLDAYLRPVINIETKAPSHEATPAELTRFRERLSSFGTLRFAVLTDGWRWTVLHLSAPRGVQHVEFEEILDIRKAPAERVTAMLEQFRALNFGVAPS